MTDQSTQIRMGEIGGALVNELINRGLPPCRMLYKVGGGWIIRVRRAPMKGGLVVQYSPDEDRILVTAKNWLGRCRGQSAVDGASGRPDLIVDTLRAIESVQ